MDTSTKILLAAGAGVITAAAAAILIRRRGLTLMGSNLKPVSTSKSINGRSFKEYFKGGMSINEKAGLIQDRIYASVKDPEMRKLALQITNHCPSRDDNCEARAIHDWVKKNIRYSGDAAPHKMGRNGKVESVDIFQSAQATREFGAGDCDDHVTINSTLAILNGIPAKIRITSEKGDGWSHVYATFGLPKNAPTKWVASDTTLPGTTKFGTEWPFARNKDFDA